MSKPIHQEIDFKASPKRIYEALMNDKEHGEFTGGPARLAAMSQAPFPVMEGMSSVAMSNSYRTSASSRRGVLAIGTTVTIRS